MMAAGGKAGVGTAVRILILGTSRFCSQYLESIFAVRKMNREILTRPCLALPRAKAKTLILL